MEYISSQSDKRTRIKFKGMLKYIKEHNLYQKKGKTGDSARMPLTDESVAANLRDVTPPSMQTVGNVKSLKHDGSHEMVIQASSSSGYASRRRGRPKTQVLALEGKG